MNPPHNAVNTFPSALALTPHQHRTPCPVRSSCSFFSLIQFVTPPPPVDSTNQLQLFLFYRPGNHPTTSQPANRAFYSENCEKLATRMARSVLSSLSCRCPLNQHEVHSPSPPFRSLPLRPTNHHHEQGCLFAPRDVMKQSSLHGSFPVCGRKKETKTSDSRHRSARTRSLFFIHFFSPVVSLFRIRVRSDDLGLSVSHDTYRQHIGSPRRSPLSLGPVPAAATSFFLFLSFFLGFLRSSWRGASNFYWVELWERAQDLRFCGQTWAWTQIA